MSFIPIECRREAIQFTGDNREKICDFLGLKKEHVELWMNADTKEKWYLTVNSPNLSLSRIVFGSWILKGKSAYEVFTDKDFRTIYEQI